MLLCRYTLNYYKFHASKPNSRIFSCSYVTRLALSQVSERTDSGLEDLDLGLTLWDGVLQLAAEVESWTAGKLSALARSPSFSAEEDIVALRVKHPFAGVFCA